MNLQLYSPKIYLFAFHLFQEPNVDEELRKKNQDFLWNKCQDIFNRFQVEKKLKIKQDPPANKRFELLDSENSEEVDLQIEPKILINNNQKLILEGFAYPLQLYDSNGISLAIGFPEPGKGN